MGDTANRDRYNKLRIDLYRRLFPHIQEEDAAAGTHGPVFHYNDPSAKWNAFESGDLGAVWNSIGLAPVIQDIFYALERMGVEDLEALESLDAVVDPLRCPTSLLPKLAASLGYELSDNLTEDQQRNAVLGIISAYKARGTWLGFKIFYRIVGFEVTGVYPLWKSDISEADDDYSRVQRTYAAATSVVMGPAGQTTYAGRLPYQAIRPGSMRIAVDSVVLRDQPNDVARDNPAAGGTFIGPGVQSGTIDYITGDFRLVLPSAPAAQVTVSLEYTVQEWPYPAARIDLEISLSPGGMGTSPVIDAAAIAGIRARMEETRPAHVLVRALALVEELADVFGEDGLSGASDATCAWTLAIDSRDDRAYVYLLDAAPAPEDNLRIEYVDGGGNITLDLFEDRVHIAYALDTLEIKQIPSGGGAETTTFW